MKNMYRYRESNSSNIFLIFIAFSHIYVARTGESEQVVTPYADSWTDDPRMSIQMLTKLKQRWKSPYKKFGFTTPMFNVCSLRRYQKRELCMILLSSEIFNIRFIPENENEYPNLSCRNIVIDASEILDHKKFEKVSISAYKCPNAYQLERSYVKGSTFNEKYFLPIRYYISGGIRQQSAVIHYQHIAPVKVKIKPCLVIFGLPVGNISQMLLERRNEFRRWSPQPLTPFFEPNIDRKVIADEIGVVRYAYVAEYGVANSIKIQRMAPYSKFTRTYKRRNICALKALEKLKLCRFAFENTIYKTRISKAGNYICQRRRIVLNYLKKNTLTSSEYPILRMNSLTCSIWKWGSVNSFLLSSHLDKNAMIAFIRISPFPEMIPDAIIRPNPV